MMNGKFTFNDVPSSKYGVFMTDDVVFSSAPTTYTATEVEGRDGAVYSIGGLKDFTHDISCVGPASNRDKIAAWLRGAGNLLIDDRYKQIQIYDQIDFVKVGNYVQFSIPAIEEPYWHDNTEQTHTMTEAGSFTVVNSGTAFSYPKIHIVTTSQVKITIGSIDITIEPGNVNIDCRNRYEDAPGLTSLSGYWYPGLNPGENTITVSGACTVTFRDTNWWY